MAGLAQGQVLSDRQDKRPGAAGIGAQGGDLSPPAVCSWLAWLKAKSFVVDKISGLVLLGLALKVVI
ncbi:hypothetical protein [Aeromonas rivipollensis]|uniref:hypothetical protein n=1 Tax=Aeromonas rivipollensis TaxID=948519 RepID=UPI003D01FD1B